MTATENILADQYAAYQQQELRKANEAREQSTEQAANKAKKPARAKKPVDPAQAAAKAAARARAKARQQLAQLDERHPDEIYGLTTPVTQESHPNTYMVRFREPGLTMEAGYLTSRSFRNLLEGHIERIDQGKQRSFHYPQATLDRIRNGIEIPPENWPQQAQCVATWK